MNVKSGEIVQMWRSERVKVHREDHLIDIKTSMVFL